MWVNVGLCGYCAVNVGTVGSMWVLWDQCGLLCVQCGYCGVNVGNCGSMGVNGGTVGFTVCKVNA